MERYFIQTTQVRADGDVNYPEKDECYSLKTAYSKFYSKVSAAFVDTTYPQIGIALFDAVLNELEHKVVTTSYVAPATEETAEAIE